MTGRPARGWPWLTWALFLGLVLPFALVGHHIGDTDTFYHLSSGRWMVQEGRLLDREVFSFTRPGEPWIYHSWLFGYLVFRLHELGGFPALNAFRALLVLATMTVVFRNCWVASGGRRLPTLATSMLAFAIYMPRATSLRPHLVSYLFLSLTVLLLQRLRSRRRRWEPWLPLLAVPWSNLHGVEYPVVFTAIGAYATADLVPHLRSPLRTVARDWTILRWGVLLGATAIGFAANPYTFRLFGVVAGALEPEAAGLVGELQSFPIDSFLDFTIWLTLPNLHYFSYYFLAVLAAAPAWVRARDWPAVVLVLVTTTLTVRGVRFASELAVLSAGFVAAGLAARLEREPGRWIARAGLLAAILIVGTAGARTAWGYWQDGRYRSVSDTAYPVGATEYLRQHGLRGHIFNEPTMGGYVTWALWPGVQTFMDMRVPGLFDARMMWLARGILTGQREMPLALLQREWEIDFVLVQRDRSLVSRLRSDTGSGFTLVYADWGFVLFVRSDLVAARGLGPALRTIDLRDETLRYVADLPAAARQELRQEVAALLATWPRNTLALETELALLLADARWEEAARLAERVTRSQATPYVRYAAAVALAHEGRDAEAWDRLRSLTTRGGDFAEVYSALAEIGLRLGRRREAREAMEHYATAKVFLLTGTEYGLLGNTRYQSGAWAPAVEAYERALLLTEEDHPDRVTLETNLASALIETGETARAAGLLASILQKHRPFPEAEYNLARAWARLGRAEDARRLFSRLADDGSVPVAIRQRARERLEGR